MPQRLLSDQPLKIDLTTAVEWEHHLQAALIEAKGPGGWRSQAGQLPDDLAVAAVDYWLSTFRTRLRLALIKPGLFKPFAVAVSEAALDADAPIWHHALQEATRRLKTDQQVAWTAVVGPHDEWIGSPLALEGQTVVGPLRLIPGDPQPRELPGGDPWWPIIVEGHVRSYAFQAARVHAGRDLRQLMALLSLAGPRDYAFAVRLGPEPPDANSGLVPRRELPPPDIQRLTIPDWLHGAWERLGGDPRLLGSLLIHAEGMELWKKHPSLAVVAFVAAIEGIGARYVPLGERCKECEQQRGARKRFTYAVELGADPVMVQQFRRIYDKFRSPTAHEGKLHDAEVASGERTMPSLLAAISGLGMGFMFEQLHDCMMLSTKLLSLALKGELPSPTTD